MVVEVLLILLIVNIVQNFNPYVLFSFHFQFCTSALSFKFDYKHYMLISYTLAYHMRFDFNSSMGTSISN